MPRQRLYSTNAERQAAYRDRLAVRQAQTEPGSLAVRVQQLEIALTSMTSRAETAERRAVEAERQAGVAVEQVRALKLSLAATQHQLEATESASKQTPATGTNRQARRKAERDARRRRQ